MRPVESGYSGVVGGDATEGGDVAVAPRCVVQRLYHPRVRELTLLHHVYADDLWRVLQRLRHTKTPACDAYA